jgi:hypothetical protein
MSIISASHRVIAIRFQFETLEVPENIDRTRASCMSERVGVRGRGRGVSIKQPRMKKQSFFYILELYFPIFGDFNINSPYDFIHEFF